MVSYYNSITLQLPVSNFPCYTYISLHLCKYSTENKIDGDCFLELTEADVKEMVKPIGTVKKILKILNKCKVILLMCIVCLCGSHVASQTMHRQRKWAAI